MDREGVPNKVAAEREGGVLLGDGGGGVSVCYLCALCDELRSVELCHHALQHLVDDGGQDALVVVLSQLLVEDGQVGRQRPGQHSQRDVHHLKV